MNISALLTAIETCKNLMENIAKKTLFEYRFDFEIGYLIKSPCRVCNQRDALPKCLDNCEIIDKIQSVISEGISCTRNY